MRLFLGIDLPFEQKNVLRSTLEPLVKKYPSFDWIPLSLYHATLQFFGEVNDVNTLDESIKRATFDKKSFYLYGIGFDFFATFQLVIHMIYKRERSIDIIVDDLEKLFPFSSRQRKFVFHTTVARAKKSSKQQYFHLRKQLRNLKVNISFPVQSLVLFSSVKLKGIRQYQIIKKYPLLF